MVSNASDRRIPRPLTGNEDALKVLIVGHFGAGKTTFVHGLSQIEPVSTEEVMTKAGEGVDHSELPGKRHTTVAMDFGRLHLSDHMVLYLFGAPGQERFLGPMLASLAIGAIGAVVLTDTRRLEETHRVLDQIEALGMPYLVAVNRFDGAPSYPAASLRQAMDLDEQTPLVECDARDRISARDALITLVRHRLAQLPAEQTR